MTKKAKICQYVVLVYLALAIGAGVMAFVSAAIAHTYRAQGTALLLIAVRCMFFLMILRWSKIWIWSVGLFLGIAVVVLPALDLYRVYMIPSFSWSLPKFIISEVLMIISAVCCFMLESELKKQTNQEVQTTNMTYPA